MNRISVSVSIGRRFEEEKVNRFKQGDTGDSILLEINVDIFVLAGDKIDRLADTSFDKEWRGENTLPVEGPVEVRGE